MQRLKYEGIFTSQKIRKRTGGEDLLNNFPENVFVTRLNIGS
jgi:hypothetical protein